VALDANFELVFAALDLNLVKLLRDAIRTTDLAGAKQNGPLNPQVDILDRPRLHPTPYYTPRPVIHPMPRYEARPVIHPTPRVEPAPPIPCPPEPCPHANKSPFVPPWKILPWQNPPQPALKVKLIKLKPDIVRTGSLLDCML
jgi:hypothetical protein